MARGLREPWHDEARRRHALVADGHAQADVIAAHDVEAGAVLDGHAQADVVAAAEAAAHVDHVVEPWPVPDDGPDVVAQLASSASPSAALTLVGSGDAWRRRIG